MSRHEEWLLKAEHDLRSAKKLLEGDNPVPDTAIFHAQQCAEKSLKAYLSFKQQPFQRSHDLEFLVELCSEFDERFGLLSEDAKILNPYSIAFRYPDIMLEPDMEDVLEALKRAENIFDFTSRLLVG